MFEPSLFVDRWVVGANCAAVAGARRNERRRGRTTADVWKPCAGCCATATAGLGQLTYDVHALCALDGRGRVGSGAGQQADALHPLLVDSTTVRAHQHASGAGKKTSRRPFLFAMLALYQ